MGINCANNCLILKEIFNYLTLGELMKMRLVCKDWRSMIDQFVSTKDELIFFIDAKIQPFYWYYEKRPIDTRNLVIVKNDFYNDYDYLKRWFKTVKRILILSYSKIGCNKILNEFLDEFVELEHLQLNFYFCPNKFFNFNRELDSDKLQTFYSSKSVHLNRLKCENLVKISSFNKFEITNSLRSIDKIQFLSLTYIKPNRNLVFRNLEVLVLRSKLYDFIPNFIRTNFPKLKQFFYFYEASYFFDYNGYNYYTNTFNSLFNQLNQEPKIDLFLNGLKYNDRSKDKFKVSMNRLDLGLTQFLELYEKDEVEFNLEMYENDVLYYSDLLGKLTEKYHKTLFKIIFRMKIQHLYIKELFCNYERFINLKNYFNVINSIYVQINLNQDQLNILPEGVPNVRAIRFDKEFIGDNVNYEFLAKFEYLQILSIQFKNNLTLLLELEQFIDDFKYFKRIESDDNVIIKRKKNKKYLLKRDKTKQLFASYGEVLEALKKANIF